MVTLCANRATSPLFQQQDRHLKNRVRKTAAFKLAKKLHWNAKVKGVELRQRYANHLRARALKAGVSAKPHSLPGPLVVSLTSYPPRFPTLYPTLICLLTQSVRPDHVILWIADKDMALLPAKVRALGKYGLDIRAARDTGPYKKIIPAIEAFPEAFIVTADDDIDYDAHWLRDLVDYWDGDANHIVFHRGHEMKLRDDGRPDRYVDWRFCIDGPRHSALIFPTGAGGVLYPPGSLSPDVTNEAEFTSLCRRADDIWLYWMGRRAGSSYLKTPGRTEVLHGLDSQDVALTHENVQGGANDQYIAQMIAQYGWPGA